MKIQVNTEILQKKLSFINHSLSSKSQLPVLQNFLLETRDNTIVLSGTDLEIGIETICKATVVEPGAVTIPIKTFTELINSLPVETVTIETVENTVRVTSKKTKSVFQTIPKEEFPKLYEEKGSQIASLSAEQMRKDIISIVFAASIDTTKPALSGILLKQEKEGFLFVATDGYRLSLKRHQALKSEEIVDANQDIAMIIPARIFRELSAVKEESDYIVMYISKTSNQVLFEMGETLIVGRLIEATYPNYEKIIPGDFSAQTVFDREELQKAVKICSIFARDNANIITLSLKKDSIIVSSKTASAGENTVTVEASLTGEENEIAFNAKYLLDVLGNVTAADRLEFAMTGPLNPGVFKIDEDESYLHLIMPIRLQS